MSAILFNDASDDLLRRASGASELFSRTSEIIICQVRAGCAIKNLKPVIGRAKRSFRLIPMTINHLRNRFSAQRAADDTTKGDS